MQISITLGKGIMDAKSYWNRVKLLLKQNKKTIQSLARTCRRPQATVYGWIAKEIYPTILEGHIIARYLGVSTGYLLTGKNEIQTPEIKNIRLVLKELERRLARV